MKKRLQNSIAVSLLISLGIHIGFALALKWAPPPPPPHQNTQNQIEVTVLEKTKTSKKLQVVDQSPQALNHEVPQDAKYLSRFNQRVIRETKAAQKGKFNNRVQKGGTPKASSQAKSFKKGKWPSLKQLRPQFSAKKFLSSAQSSQNLSQQAQTEDYLKDVPTGVQTLLSTRQFVFFSYYERIRDKLRQHWEPRLRAKIKKIFAQGRTIAATTDKITKVMIILNDKGELLKIQILSRSGFKDIDDAAVEAFKAAQPFPNPPKGLKGPDGTIKIFWDFVLES